MVSDLFLYFFETEQYPHLFSLRVHHEGRFSELPKRKYVGGQVTFVDLIAIDQFNIDLLNSIMYQSLGYEENVKMYYHYKVPLKGLDTGLRPLGGEDDFHEVVKHVNRHRVIYVFVEHGHTNVDLEAERMQSLKQTDKCKELDSNVEVVELETEVNMSSESEDDENNKSDGKSVDENNESDGKSIDENLENDESDSEYEQSTEGEDDELEEFVDEEHIVEEVHVNMSTFSFEVEPQTYDLT